MSLKGFLIGATLLGVGGGVLYRLLVTQPQVFQLIVALLCGPFALLLLLATAMRSAMRPRGTWEPPRCGECGSPLELASTNLTHVCQQCGVELGRLEQLRFERSPERDSKALRWIVVAVALPLLGLAATAFFFPQGRTYASMSTARVISVHLDANTPWAWRELEHRAARGALTNEHADALLSKLASIFKQQRATQSHLHLPWGRDLIADPTLAQLASDEALAELASAVYQPKVDLRSSGAKPGVVEIVVRAPGVGPFMTFPLEAYWEVIGFTAEGEPVPYLDHETAHATRPGGQVMVIDSPSDVVGVEVRVSVFRGAQKLDGFETLPRSSRAVLSAEEAIKTWTLSAEKKLSGN